MPCDSGPLLQMPIAGSMPSYQPQPQPRRPAPQARPSGRSGMYLPPMPEMLTAARGQPAADPRYGQANRVPPSPVQTPPKTEPIVRGQSADGPTNPQRGPTIPAPEALGLNSTSTHVHLDWNAARTRLERLGAAFYRLERASDGSHHFSLALPYADRPSEHRQFEARAATEEEAVRVALQQAEQWKAALR